jgi:ribosomal protein L29
MKNNKALSQEMKNMSIEQLRVAVDEVRRELFQLRLKSTTGHVKSFASDQRRLKSSIARGLTYLHQKIQA